MKHLIRCLFIVGLIAQLVACGGGSGGSGAKQASPKPRTVSVVYSQSGFSFADVRREECVVHSQRPPSLTEANSVFGLVGSAMLDCFEGAPPTSQLPPDPMQSTTGERIGENDRRSLTLITMAQEDLGLLYDDPDAVSWVAWSADGHCEIILASDVEPKIMHDALGKEFFHCLVGDYHTRRTVSPPVHYTPEVS